MRRPMRRFSALFVLALPLAAGCTIADQIRSRDLIREGNSAYGDGQFEAAIEKYNASLELEPDGVTVLWNRACAAESLVLNLKEASDPKQVEARRKFADIALADFQAWLDALEMREEGQVKNVASHRLALMRADNRCDDLVSHYLKQHREQPQDQSLYPLIAKIEEDVCGREDKADEWFEKRVRDFPKSPEGWYALAKRKFDGNLMSDGMSGLPFNDALPADARLRIANEVISHLNEATGIKPTYQDPYRYRKMAYIQRQFARVFDEQSGAPQDRLQSLLAREDSMLAWKEEKALCELEQKPACPVEVAFDAAAKTPALFEGQRVVLSGAVVPGSVARDAASTPDRAVYRISLQAAADPAADGSGASGTEKKPEGDAQVVQVRYAFEFEPPKPEEGAPVPVAEEGAPPPEDPVAVARKEFDTETAEMVTSWKPGSTLMLTGTFQGGLFETKAELPMNCCPPPPITDEEYAADLELRATLETEIAALTKAAEAEAAKKGAR